MCKFDAVVLGAGAAGLLCAIEAGKRGLRVAVLEHAERIGKKILISGGGRCNFTNLYCQPKNFISANEHFAKSALARYTPADFIALIEKHGIPYHEKTPGQLFCDRSAQDIINLLESECRSAGVQIFLQSRIREVQRTTEFIVRNESGEFRAPVLVVATGGLSIPKMGATPLGYELARQFGLKIVETRPALVPFVLAGKDRTRYCGLAGVSAEVISISLPIAIWRSQFVNRKSAMPPPHRKHFKESCQSDSPNAGWKTIHPPPGTMTLSQNGRTSCTTG